MEDAEIFDGPPGLDRLQHRATARGAGCRPTSRARGRSCGRGHAEAAAASSSTRPLPSKKSNGRAGGRPVRGHAAGEQEAEPRLFGAGLERGPRDPSRTRGPARTGPRRAGPGGGSCAARSSEAREHERVAQHGLLRAERVRETQRLGRERRAAVGDERIRDHLRQPGAGQRRAQLAIALLGAGAGPPRAPLGGMVEGTRPRPWWRAISSTRSTSRVTSPRQVGTSTVQASLGSPDREAEAREDAARLRHRHRRAQDGR